MATQTDDATSNNGESAQTSHIDKMAEVKRNLDAKAGGDSSDFADEDKDDTTNNDDAEADNANHDDDSADDTTDDDTTDDSTDDSEDDDDNADDKQGSDFRFSQFKGDGSEEAYRKNLENAYLNSSNEAINLKNERDGYERQVNAIKEAAGKDPEFGEKLLSLLNGGNGGGSNGSGGDNSDGSKVTQDSNNPFLKNAETEWNKKSEESVKAFVDANPEVMTDPKINADVKRWMRVFSNDIYENEGRLITAGEAMEMAYRHLGLDDKRTKTQDLVDGMKKNAAPTRPQAPKKKPSKSGGDTKQFSDLTMDIASRMGISKDRLAKGSKR